MIDIMRAMISIFAALIGHNAALFIIMRRFLSGRPPVLPIFAPFVVSRSPDATNSESDAPQFVLQQESGGRAAAWQIKK